MKFLNYEEWAIAKDEEENNGPQRQNTRPEQKQSKTHNKKNERIKTQEN